MMIFQDGQTALHQAASAGHGETVAALILGGCDVSLQDFVSFFPFIFAMVIIIIVIITSFLTAVMSHCKIL